MHLRQPQALRRAVSVNPGATTTVTLEAHCRPRNGVGHRRLDDGLRGHHERQMLPQADVEQLATLVYNYESLRPRRAVSQRSAGLGSPLADAQPIGRYRL